MLVRLDCRAPGQDTVVQGIINLGKIHNLISLAGM